MKEAVDSALNQIGFDEYDVIVVDNDPDRDDETEKLMLNYNNPKLSYYKNMKNIEYLLSVLYTAFLPYPAVFICIGSYLCSVKVFI